MYQKLTDGPTPKEVRLKQPVVLFRPPSIAKEYQDELRISKRDFHTVDSRMMVHGGDLVIGRYSVLPFYAELEEDLKHRGAVLLNSYRDHRYVADLRNWYDDLSHLTPRTWFRLEDVPDNVGPVVLKGETNSRKDRWSTHMYAANKREAVEVYCRLNDDTLISQQNIYIREFVPLVTLATGINGQPITKEFRFFVCDGTVLCGGYYWSNFVDDLEVVPSVSEVPQAFLQNVIDNIKGKVRFVVIDVAQMPNGEWVVIELNDAQCAGLSECDPKLLYKNLKNVLWDSQFTIHR